MRVTVRVTVIDFVAVLIGATVGTGAIGAGSAGAPGYSILAVEEMLGRVTILAADDPQRRVSVPVGFKPHEIVVSPDGRFAYVSNFGLNDADNRNGTLGDTVSVIDVEHARVRTKVHLPAGLKAPHGLGFRPRHGLELFVNAEQGDEMVVFDAAKLRVERTFGLPPGVHNFVFSQDGAQLLAFASAGTVYRIDPDTGRVVIARDMGAPVRGLALTHDGLQLIASVKGEIAILDASDLVTVKRFPLPGAPQSFYCAESSDGREIFVPSVFDGSVRVLDASAGVVIRTLVVGTPLRVVMSPDPDLAYVGNVSPNGHSIAVIHVHSLETEAIGGMRDVNGLAFSSVVPRVLRGARH